MKRMLGDNYDRLMEARAKQTPLKRCVTAEDVAETMLALIECNRFVTGERSSSTEATRPPHDRAPKPARPDLARHSGSGRMAVMGNATEHPGRWTLEDRFASPWHYLPVELPAGTAGLRVELEYDRAGGAVLDLGCLGPQDFRGWSGGARKSFVITPGAATPGYLPGELEAGTWQVMIGVHRVPPDGTGFRVTAETTCGPGRWRRRRWRPLPRSQPNGRRAGSCRPGPATAGWPATCTRTPCTRTAS